MRHSADTPTIGPLVLGWSTPWTINVVRCFPGRICRRHWTPRTRRLTPRICGHSLFRQGLDYASGARCVEVCIEAPGEWSDVRELVDRRPSDSAETTTGAYVLAGYPAPVMGGEERDNVGHVGGVAEAAERSRRSHSRLHIDIRIAVPEQVGVSGSW